MQAIAFYLFSIIELVAGVLVVTARNPVHAVLWLIVAFFNAAGLMVLVGAEFIAMLLVIVYVGAVAVLFLFVVMMLDVEFSTLRGRVSGYLPIGLVLAVALAAEVVIGVNAYDAGGLQLAHRAAPMAGAMPNIQALGVLLYTRYLFVFEAAGLVLLVAMIGAIVLTHRQRVGTRPQNVNRQNARRPQDATRNVNQPVGAGIEL